MLLSLPAATRRLMPTNNSQSKTPVEPPRQLVLAFTMRRSWSDED